MWSIRAAIVGLLVLWGIDISRGAQSASVTEAVEVPDWSATGALRDADVRSAGRECRDWTGSRYRCGGRSWEWVGRHIGAIVADGVRDTRPCLWIHPKKGGATRVTYPRVRLGAQLVGYAGLLASARDGAPTTVTVTVGDTKPVRSRLTDRRPGWHEINIDTHHLAGTEAPVAIELSASKPDWRHVCVQLIVEPENAQ